ncbi:unnamed protein product [Medioppia subpectinata]|uniref:Uncharacterized protein n=1 Tax=Medioppia subpectinata TaxID=1979941 RepID=A0A7R9KK02_9ACAR|nr:unnamed protein product [Medioppia subpectinata]CAG2103749.1 unnamed protein product [Medioppia subpectinata]
MFSLKVTRLLLLFCLTFAFASGAKSFIKGLIIGGLLGHKKAALLHEKGGEEHKEHYEKEYVPMPVHKEYIPVPMHDEPKYIPIYIVKECTKKSEKSYSFDDSYDESDSHFAGNGDKYLGEDDAKDFDGYESRERRVTKMDTNSLNIDISAQKN